MLLATTNSSIKSASSGSSPPPTCRAPSSTTSGSASRSRNHDGHYAFVHRNPLTVRLAAADPPLPRPAGSIYVHVDDVEQLAEEWPGAGVEFTGPADLEYGKREGFAHQPGRHLIRLGSRLER
jgi:hypothetical protein